MFHSKCVTFRGIWIGDMLRCMRAVGDCSALLLCIGVMMIVVYGGLVLVCA